MALRDLLHRAVDTVLGAESTGTIEYDEDAIAVLERAVDDLRRRNREYFDVIASLEKQRDEWRGMFFDSSQKSMNAHVLYRRQITSLSLKLKRAINMLNGFFVIVGHEPVKTEKDFDAISERIADNYRNDIDALKAAAPVAVDGAARRKEIAAAGEPAVKPEMKRGMYWFEDHYVRFGDDDWSLPRYKALSGDGEASYANVAAANQEERTDD